MELTGRIVAVQPVQTGEGRNGTWKKQECVVEYDRQAQYPRKMMFVLWGDKNALKVVTTTAIDPEKRTALDGNLFSREAHRRRQTYHGLIHGDENLVGRVSHCPSMLRVHSMMLRTSH